MLKKNWVCYSATERIYGTVIKRWYLKSPSGHYYLIYRSNQTLCLSTGPDPLDYTCLHTQSGDIVRTFHNAMKIIYEIEANDRYEQTISHYVKNLPECINLFATNKNIKITSY